MNSESNSFEASGSGNVRAIQAELLPLPEDYFVRLADAFAALADPTRVRLAWALCRREMSVSELVELTGMAQSTVSHHLRLLRTMHLVRSRRGEDGRTTFYAIDDPHVESLLGEAIEHIEEFI
jgi:DNA-binding transcriptional ArsR family regulator